MSKIYDIAIIGLGPAGLEAANLAIKNNLDVIAFEKNKVGGTCLNKGCIPTKAMVHVANEINDFEKLNNENIINSDLKINFKNLVQKRNDIVSKFNKALDLGLSKKIELINNAASLIIEDNIAHVECENKIYNAKNIIVASGSDVKEICGLEINHDKIISSDDIFNLENPPKEFVIVGSGAIGLEIGYLFSKMGSNVTIVEKALNLAPAFDIDISKRIERILKSNNIKYYKNDYIKTISKNITLASGIELQYDYILSAVGRKPVLPNIKGDISKAKNLYIIGDSLGDIMLAHKASFDAKQVMNKILYNKTLPNKQIPKIVYIMPEIASVGLNENEVENPEIKKVMLSSIAKAWCDDNTDGFIKIILKDNIIKGVHIVSKSASELIVIGQMMIDNNYTKEDVLNMVFPHPSLAEIYKEAMEK